MQRHGIAEIFTGAGWTAGVCLFVGGFFGVRPGVVPVLRLLGALISLIVAAPGYVLQQSEMLVKYIGGFRTNLIVVVVSVSVLAYATLVVAHTVERRRVRNAGRIGRAGRIL